MAASHNRLTHHHDGSIAVFLIGMTVNKPWRVDRWGPVFAAMPAMLAELSRNRAEVDAGQLDRSEDLGFLWARTVVGGRGPTVVQYWRSVEDIYRYASATEHQHRPAWTGFNRRARTADGAVGIWHETYAVPAGAHESMYVDTPTMGLAAATGVVPAARTKAYARVSESAPVRAGHP